MTKSITRLDLIEGGTILRQGHFTSLAFSPRDADGAIVDLTGKTIDVVIVGRPGIVYETKGTFDSVEKIIEFKISKNIGHGYMWFEITVTDPNDATYRQKFPTDEYQGKLEFIRSSDDVDYVGFSGKTIGEFEKMFNAAAAAMTKDSEVALARGGFGSLGEKLESDKQATARQLAETGENLNARLDAKIIDSGAANAEVSDARISTVKSKSFSTVRNRFEENEADVKRITAENAAQFPATNLIKNGDFKNGLSDWLTSGAALSVVGNTLQLVGSGALTEYAANQRVEYVTGHKYFVKFTAKTLNPLATRIRGRFAGGYANVDVLNPVNGTPYTKSTVFTATVGGLYTDGIQFLYPSTTDATGATGMASHVMSVDLTAAFGSGKEPTVEKFETLLLKFENNWFGGTRAVITVKDVYETSPTNTEVFTPFEKTQVAKISSLEKTVATIAPEVNLSGINEAYIIACQEDESPAVSGATLSMDTTNFKVGSRGYKLTGTAAGTMQLNLTPSITPMKVPNIGVVGLWIYVPDKTKISSIWVNLYSSADSAVTWEVSSAYSESLVEQGGLQNGWNYIRWHASQSTNTTIHNLTNWGNIYKARVMVVTSGATNITIGKLVGETNKKAKMIFVEDSQFRTFYNVAYPQLKERNMPVTWALRISTIGTQVGTVGEQITEEEIEKLSLENRNSISLHSYDGITGDLTAQELRVEMMKSIKWLKARGYTGTTWRPAFLRNAAPAASAIRDLVSAYSTNGEGSAQYLLGAFPFLNRWKTPRLGIHGVTNAQIDKYFSDLKKTNQLFIVYTHGVSETVVGDINLATWNYFISKVDEAIAEGWLEGTTFEELNAQYKAYKEM